MKNFALKLKNRLSQNEYGYLIYAFILPLMIMWLIYIAMEVYPFGTNSVLVLDLNGQYVYFFAELREKILEGGSMLYTWSRTLGGEFMGIYAYYLSSPFSYLVALFPKDHITEALLCIILLKTGSMGLTMGIYLHNISKKINKLYIVIFASMYALSAYAVVQAHNTMWIDNLIMLPLVALGIEQLIKKHKCILFMSALSISLLTSFYIGYMTCIFVAAYFFYYYFAHNENDENNFYLESNHFWKSFARIAVSSATAIAIAAVILLPAYYSLQFGKTTFSDPKFTFTQRFDFLDLFTKLFPGSYDTVRPEGLPFLYCGTLAVILLPVYFAAKNVKAREKMCGIALISFFLISFNISAIDMVWHGFQKPNWLNYRYSFMLVFIFVVFAFKALSEIEKIDFKFIATVSGALFIILMAIQKQDYEYIDDFKCIWLSIACVTIYTILLHVINKGYLKETISAILCVAVSLELFVAGLFNTMALDADVVISRRTSYNNFMNKLQPIVDYVKNYDQSEFYRMEKTIHRKTNDPMMLDFMGISNSTSTLNASVIKLLHRFGYSSKSHWTKYLGGTNVSDSLLGIKYVITDASTELYSCNKIYTDEETGYVAWENPNALSLAFGVNDAVLDIGFEEQDSPFLLMNETFTAMTGAETPVELFKKIDVESSSLDNVDISFVTEHRKYAKSSSNKTARMTYILNVPANVETFLCFPTDYPREADLSVNGESFGTVLGNETDRIISLGKYDEEQQVVVALTLKDDPLYIMTGYNFFYYLDNDVYEEYIPLIGDSQLNVTSFSDTLIKGNINVSSGDTTLFTSIPYDEGWTVTIDGEKAELLKTYDSLLAVPITEGEHEVVFRYMPECFVLGLTISVCGIVVFAGAVVLSIIMKKRLNKLWIAENSEVIR